MRPIKFYELKDSIFGTEISYRGVYKSVEEESDEMKKCFGEIEKLLRKGELIKYSWKGYCMVRQNEASRVYQHTAFVYTDYRLILCRIISGVTQTAALEMSEFVMCQNFDDDCFILSEIALDFKWVSIYFLYDRSDRDRVIWNLCKELNVLAQM